MKKNEKSKQREETHKEDSSHKHNEAKGLAFLTAAFVLFLCLVSFKASGPTHNWLGLIGFSLAWLLHWCFGYSSYLLIFGLSWLGWKHLSSKPPATLGLKFFYLTLLLFCTSMLFNLIAEHSQIISPFLQARTLSKTFLLSHPIPHAITRYFLGGIPAYFLYKDLSIFNLQKLLSDVGIALTFSTLSLVSFLLLCDISFRSLLEGIKKTCLWCAPQIHNLFKTLLTFPTNEEDQELIHNKLEESLTKKETLPKPPYKPTNFKPNSLKNFTDFLLQKKEKALPQPKETQPPQSDEQIEKRRKEISPFSLPPHSLLKNPKKLDQPALKKELKKQAEILEETLLSFGIEAKVGEIHCGPTITSFEVHPAIGVKVQKIKALENDIALNLQAKAIRIIAPIPGKAAVGIEIPSPYPQEVSFKELLKNYQKGSRRFHIPVLLGKTVSGENVMTDLARMPHCIIAGATGSGKSVCINTLILSILMNARPDEVKLLLVDPKKVELTPYHELPHLIAPVITEAHGAYAALNWLVKEMQFRYDVLKQLGLRNCTSFNNRKINREFEASLSIQIPEKMFAIVAIIDEFADLMMASSTDLETPIARIAQMARAVGIHLVLATQRPSREVITGLIKANFPSRIAFKVASRVNSQIILDENGAESLLGNGDLLFLPPGSSHLIRAQGAYVSDEEINNIVSYIRELSPPQYLIKSFDKMTPSEIGLDLPGEGSGRDALYDQALQIVLDTRTASTTFLQRKLKIGYARAASLVDELEANGVISPQDGSRPRKVLQSNTQLDFSIDD